MSKFCACLIHQKFSSSNICTCAINQTHFLSKYKRIDSCSQARLTPSQLGIKVRNNYGDTCTLEMRCTASHHNTTQATYIVIYVINSIQIMQQPLSSYSMQQYSIMCAHYTIMMQFKANTSIKSAYLIYQSDLICIDTYLNVS